MSLLQKKKKITMQVADWVSLMICEHDVIRIYTENECSYVQSNTSDSHFRKLMVSLTFSYKKDMNTCSGISCLGEVRRYRYSRQGQGMEVALWEQFYLYDAHRVWVEFNDFRWCDYEATLKYFRGSTRNATVGKRLGREIDSWFWNDFIVKE